MVTKGGCLLDVRMGFEQKWMDVVLVVRSEKYRKVTNVC